MTEECYEYRRDENGKLVPHRVDCNPPKPKLTELLKDAPDWAKERGLTLSSPLLPWIDWIEDDR